MKLTFHVEARIEAREAITYYRRESYKAAKQFRAELKALTERIVLTPQQFPELPHGYRRASLNHFPYSIYFEWVQESIHILAVAHSSRYPGYWRERVLPTI